jgi:hypothetical protein
MTTSDSAEPCQAERHTIGDGSGDSAGPGPAPTLSSSGLPIDTGEGVEVPRTSTPFSIVERATGEKSSVCKIGVTRRSGIRSPIQSICESPLAMRTNKPFSFPKSLR